MKKQKCNRGIYSNFLLCIKRVNIVFNVVLIFFIHFIALPLSLNFIFAMFSRIDEYLLGMFSKFNFITVSFIDCKIIYYIIQINIINCNCSSVFVI